MKDFSAASLLLLCITVLVTYSVAHLLGEYIKWHFRLRNLRSALIIEALIAVGQMKTVVEDSTGTIDKLPNDESPLEKQHIKGIPAGYAVMSPSIDFSEMVSLAGQSEGSKVVHFMDAWGRFEEYEKRLRDAHEQLIEAADKPTSLAYEEYSQQARDYLQGLRLIAAELICHSIDVIRYELRFTAEFRFYELTDCRWNTISEMEEEYRHYLSIWNESQSDGQGVE